jgi:hypothetical protein
LAILSPFYGIDLWKSKSLFILSRFASSLLHSHRINKALIDVASINGFFSFFIKKKMFLIIILACSNRRHHHRYWWNINNKYILNVHCL